MFLLRKTLKPPSIVNTVYRLIATVKLPQPPTSAAYDDLITVAGSKQDFATVRHLLNQRYADGCLATTKTFKFISTNLTALDDLLKVLSDLNEGYGRKSAYDSLVACLCKLQLVDAALRVADETVRGKISVDCRTFHPILSVLTRKKNFDAAWRVMETMRLKGIERDITCYNFFLTAYSIIGDLRLSADVLRKISDEGLEADARTYDALVLGACRAGKMDGAITILRKMSEDGVEAMYATYAHVIGNLVRLDYCAQAVEFVMSYAGKDKKLDSHNFGLLATRLIDGKRVDEAQFVLEEMVKRDMHMGEKLKKFHDEHLRL